MINCCKNSFSALFSTLSREASTDLKQGSVTFLSQNSQKCDGTAIAPKKSVISMLYLKDFVQN